MFRRELSGRKKFAGQVIRDNCFAYSEFSILGRRFIYDPDGMSLQEIGHYDPLPQQTVTDIPQFDLPVVQPAMMVVIPTLRCNLDCRYCFAKPQNVQGETNCTEMDIDTIFRAIDTIPVGRRATVCFFGGEPLLAWDKIVRAVKYAEDRFSLPSFSLTTNGTLLDDNKVRWLAEKKFSMIVSLDGPQWLHDSARPDKKGDGTYNRIIESLEIVSKYPNLAERTTLRATFDGGDKHAHLLTRIIHLNELCERYGLGNVSVEPADLSEGCGGPGIPVEPSEALYEEYLDAAEWFSRQMKAGRNPKFHHFSVRMRRLKNRKPAPTECGAGVGYLAAAPDGKLHACHRLGCVVGTVAQGVDRRLQQPWRDNRYYARHQCPDCWLRNVCGGGCRVNSVNNCGDIQKPDLLGCWLTETCVKCAAWILAETAGSAGSLESAEITPSDTPEILPDQAG